MTITRDELIEVISANAYDGGGGGLDGFQYMNMVVEIADLILERIKENSKPRSIQTREELDELPAGSQGYFSPSGHVVIKRSDGSWSNDRGQVLAVPELWTDFTVWS